MNYSFKQIYDFNNPDPLFFLCGVKYNEKTPQEDKRVVLKNFLDEKGYHSIILEQHFVPGKNGEKLGYKFIELKNLNDVETLACMLVDGIFIIHESHSTAAEIALFSSHESVANKVFILIPDNENVEENYFSGFLSLGYANLIPKPIIFYPVTEKHLINEHNMKIFTYFNNNKIGENLKKEINKHLSTVIKAKKLKVIKCRYQMNIIDSISYYFSSDNVLCISVDVHLLKYYIMAIFNISDFRREFKHATKFFDVVSICEKWFGSILLNTIQCNEKIKINDFESVFVISNSVNTRLNLRKAISFILYSFHALGWVKIEPSDNSGISISKESETSTGFKSIYTKYTDIICEYQPLNLKGILL